MHVNLEPARANRIRGYTNEVRSVRAASPFGEVLSAASLSSDFSLRRTKEQLRV